MKLTSDLHIVTRFKNEWSCTPTPPCALMVCNGTTVPLQA